MEMATLHHQFNNAFGILKNEKLIIMPRYYEKRPLTLYITTSYVTIENAKQLCRNYEVMP